jgi:GTP-binding protein YchF
MKIGLVGLPLAGKKTLFSLLIGKSMAAAFEKRGQEAVVGVASIRDDRLDWLNDLYHPKKKVPGVLSLSLIPDLEKDNAKNRDWLLALQDMDLLCYVIRAFKDGSVFHVEGSVDAQRDLSTIHTELLLHDHLLVEKRLEKLKKIPPKKAGPGVDELELLEKVQKHLEQEQPLLTLPLKEEEWRMLTTYLFLTTKPVIVLLNVDENTLADTTLEDQLRAKYQSQKFAWLRIPVKIEQELSQLESAAERQEFMAGLGIETPALDKLTMLAYKTLGLLSFFTVGEDEVRAWMIPAGSAAPRAARAIHKDLERGFIRAEVMKYQDLKTLGAESKVKEAGKYLQKGKDYIIEDGDILHILFNV